MTERDPADRLDALVDRVLRGSVPTPDTDPALAELAVMAEALRGLPSETFRSRLDAHFVSATSTRHRAPYLVALTPPRGGG